MNAFLFAVMELLSLAVKVQTL